MKVLKELRLKKGVKQKDVADYLGIARVTYTNIENGKRETDFTTLRKLATYFDVSIDYLLGTTNEPVTSNKNPVTEENLTELLVTIFKERGYLKDDQNITHKEFEKFMKMAKLLLECEENN